MVRSNIKNITSIEGNETIAEFLGVHENTITNWRKRGYAGLDFIEKLGTYPDSTLTEQDFINDYQNGIRRK